MKHLSMLTKRWLIAGLLVVALCVGSVGTAQAVVIDRDGTLPAGEVVDDDLVLTANTVLVEGTVNGTLIAAGQSITINGTIKSDAILAAENVLIGEKALIEGNIFTAGGDVVVRGKVLGSLFGASSTLTLAEGSSLGRNLYYAGYQVEAKAGSTVTRDINAAGYQFVLGGSCRHLNLAGGAMELNGKVSGNAVLYLGQMDDSARDYRPWFSGMRLPPALPVGLRISEGAVISGKLTYTSSVDQSAGFNVTPVGGTVFQTPVPSMQRENHPSVVSWRASNFGVAFWLWDLLRNLVTILILGALVFWLAPRLFERALEQVKAHSLGSIGIGFVALAVSFAAIPLAALVIVLVGLLFGVTTLFDLSAISVSVGFAGLSLACVVFYTALLWTGKLLLAFIIGQWVFSKVLPNAAAGRLWPFVMGAVIFALLAAIPYVGFLFSFVVALAGLGALWYAWRNRAMVA